MIKMCVRHLETVHHRLVTQFALTCLAVDVPERLGLTQSPYGDNQSQLPAWGTQHTQAVHAILKGNTLEIK